MDLIVQPKPSGESLRQHQSRPPTYFWILTRWRIESNTLTSTPKVWASARTTGATPGCVTLANCYSWECFLKDSFTLVLPLTHYVTWVASTGFSKSFGILESKRLLSDSNDSLVIPLGLTSSFPST